ncbi:MAG: redoxin family protein [Saprospiraceae bacterium]|nr:redoxin family protein [Saprospiraceae bacterium]
MLGFRSTCQCIISLALCCLIASCACEQVRRVTFDFQASPQAIPKQEVPALPIGARAPDFRLPGADSVYHNLSDFADAKVLVIIFTCNHCPTAQAYEERIKNVTSEYADKGVQVVAISPNSPISLLYEELGYSDLDDDYEDMVIRARDLDYNFPYLYDGDDHAVSLQYGPTTTPHAFVFDKDRKLTYRGRIDMSEKPPGQTNAMELRLAIDYALEGRELIVKETASFGCSVKWAWKTEYKDKVQADWESKPVTLQTVGLDSLKTVFTNLGSQLLLVNFWATWCAPCKLEFPEFPILQRMYGDRAFQFVSVSMDKIEKKGDALRFLQQVHAPVPNYIVDANVYDVIKKVEVEWDGSLPFTMLIEPLGKVVEAWHGTIDPLEVKRAIVEHRMMGRYY